MTVRAQIILLDRFNTVLLTRAIVAAALSVFTVACAEPPKRVNPVGLSFVAYEDTARRSWTGPQDRPLATAVWYPAAPGSRESEWRVGIFNAGWNAQKAPLSAATTKRALVVLSHGTGGGAAGMAWLAETLASNGYIVAAVNHHGNTAAEPSYQLQGFILVWERARDISVLIDKLLADPQFGAHIDPSRIGVAGFSLGGYTALATVGARFAHQQWKSFCAGQPAEPSCNLASLAEVKVPVRIIVGSKDDQAFPDVNARPIASAIPSAEIEIIPNVTHYTFLARCTLWGKVVARSLCADPDEIDREEVHRRVSADALKFFNRTLQR